MSQAPSQPYVIEEHLFRLVVELGERCVELEAAELVPADLGRDAAAPIQRDPARVQHELCSVPGRERSSRCVLEHLIAEAA